MKPRWLSALLSLCAAQALAGDGMPWAKDYASARTPAAASGKLIMIFFTSDR
jgi:hypothetical protein